VLQIQGDESVLLRITHSNLKSFFLRATPLAPSKPTNQSNKAWIFLGL
jgi:hypothetical protein